MRMMMKVQIPVDKGNVSIKDGSLPNVVMGSLERLKPESAYFGTERGKRTAFIVFDMKDVSDMPSIAEPFFDQLNAEVTFTPVMTADDLKAGLQKAAR